MFLSDGSEATGYDACEKFIVFWQECLKLLMTSQAN